MLDLGSVVIGYCQSIQTHVLVSCVGRRTDQFIALSFRALAQKLKPIIDEWRSSIHPNELTPDQLNAVRRQIDLSIYLLESTKAYLPKSCFQDEAVFQENIAHSIKLLKSEINTINTTCSRHKIRFPEDSLG